MSESERNTAIEYVAGFRENVDFSNLSVEFILDQNENLIDRVFLIGILQYNHQVLLEEHFNALLTLFNFNDSRFDSFLANLFTYHFHNPENIPLYLGISNLHGAILCISNALKILLNNSSDLVLDGLESYMDQILDMIYQIITNPEINLETKYEAAECFDAIRFSNCCDLTTFLETIFKFYSEQTEYNFKILSVITQAAISYPQINIVYEFCFNLFINLSQNAPHSDKSVVITLVNLGYVICYGLEYYANDIDTDSLVKAAFSHSIYPDEEYLSFQNSIDEFFIAEINSDTDNEDDEPLQSICFRILHRILSPENGYELIKDYSESVENFDSSVIIKLIDVFGLNEDPSNLVDLLDKPDSEIKNIVAKGNFIRYVSKAKCFNEQLLEQIFEQNSPYLFLYLLDSLQEENFIEENFPLVFYKFVDTLKSFETNTITEAIFMIYNLIDENVLQQFLPIDEQFIASFNLLLELSSKMYIDCSSEAIDLILSFLKNEQIKIALSNLIHDCIVHCLSIQEKNDAGVIFLGKILQKFIAFDQSLMNSLLENFLAGFEKFGINDSQKCRICYIVIFSFCVNNDIEQAYGCIGNYLINEDNIVTLVNVGSLIFPILMKNHEFATNMMRILAAKNDFQSSFIHRILIPCCLALAVDRDNANQILSNAGISLNEVLYKIIAENINFLFIDSKIFIMAIIELGYQLENEGTVYTTFDIVIHRLNLLIHTQKRHFLEIASLENKPWDSTNFIDHDPFIKGIPLINYDFHQFITLCISPRFTDEAQQKIIQQILKLL